MHTADRNPRLRRRRRRGATIVETAITLPVFLLILLGIIEFGATFFARHNMVHAARVGARHLSLGAGTEADSEQAARDLLTSMGIIFPSLSVSVTGPTGPDDHDCTCTVSVLASEASLGDPLSLMGSDVITVRVVMRDERELGTGGS